jgi:hypothetical protein
MIDGRPLTIAGAAVMLSERRDMSALRYLALMPPPDRKLPPAQLIR